ncbi:MAG: tandem-95 repeat protein, partial [Planctomycetales bacterium]|nr:tandem-95 repeat protein [Planctomycetales bacterium]
EVFIGRVGRTYEFLALATDLAGNREVPPAGQTAADDGTTTSLGVLPTVDSTTRPNFGQPSVPTTTPSTNPLFDSAENLIPSTASTSSPAIFDVVLQPFTAKRFADGFDITATGVATSGIGPMAITETPNGDILISGGTARNQLYLFTADGGTASGTWTELDHPIFNLIFDNDGRLWATTGGGPLLQLDPVDGNIIAEYGDGLTMGLAIDPANGDVIVGSRYGVERFDPATGTFERLSRDLDLRVGSLAYADDGTLYGVQWPERDAVVKFNPLGRAETVLSFQTPIDSIAFGKSGTSIEGLLFISHNTGNSGFGQSVATGENSEMTMVDVATLRRVAVASGGTRGDVVYTTSDGRVLVSQSEQVDVISPIAVPEIVATNPAEQTIVALPLGLVSVTFSEDMFTGLGTELGSVLNPGNYAIRGDGSLPADQHPVITEVRYHQDSRTAYLFVQGFSTGDFTLYIGQGIESVGGFTLPAGYEVHFSTISEFSANVDIQLTGTRFDRQTQAITYEVQIRNDGDYDLLLPMSLVLDPAGGDVTSGGAVPGQVAIPGADDRWLFDLTANVPDGVRLQPGESTTAKTIRLLGPNNVSPDFVPGFLATASPNLRPGFDTDPMRFATAGALYTYDADATDPDGVAVAYLLRRGPEGMQVDADTGVVQWTPDAGIAEDHDVVLYAFDSRGGFTSQSWTIRVSGGNRAPEFVLPPGEARMSENETLQVIVNVDDRENDPIDLWVENMPAGAFFDPAAKTLWWTPGENAAGIYKNVTLVASDGVNVTRHAFDLLVSQADRPPVIEVIPEFTLRQGDEWTYRIGASDPDGDSLLFTSTDLPAGATLDAREGTLRWVVGFDVPSARTIPITVTANGKSVHSQIDVGVINANGAPNFDSMRGWSVEEGQTLVITSFAFDPDHPDFELPVRLENGTLDPPGVTSPITYRVTGLPDGASFDPETATLTWTPRYDQSGEYTVLFEATDDGDSVSDPITVSSRVPISVRDINQRPVIDPVSNLVLSRGNIIDIPVSVSDPDGDNITLEAANGLPGLPLPEFVSFTDNGNGTGLFHFEPGAGDRGNYTLSLIASDDGNGHGRGRIETVQYDFVVTVQSLNDPPLLQSVSSLVVLAGDLLRLPIKATDIDQEPLTFSMVGLPGEARLVDAARYGEALLNWDPTTSDIGQYNVTVTVTDEGNGDISRSLSSSQSFVINVRDNNAAPTLTVPANATVDEGGTLSVVFTASDPDNDTIRFTADNLPSGATIDPVTGTLGWSPTFDDAGTYTFNVIASDGSSSDVKPFTITIGAVNRAPRLAFPAAQYAREGVFTEFRVTGADFDGGALVLSVTDLPDGALFDASTGRFRWQPRFDQAGRYDVTFTLTDSESATDTITVPIVVENVNRVPVIESRHHQVVVGELLDFTIAGTDPDADDTLTFSAYGLPEGATIDPATGRITWVPNPGQLGRTLVDVRASDGLAETKHVVVIDSVAKPQLPDVRIVTTPSFPAMAGQTVRVQVIADGFAPIDKVELTLDGVPVALDSAGRGEIVAGLPGKQSLIATATDEDGFVGSAQETLRVRDTTDTDPPVLSLSLGGVTTAIEPVDLIASILDSNLDDWTLEIAARNSNDFRTIAEGETTGAGLVLATIDPSTLANGFYTLRLRARDISGRSSASTIDLAINTSVKSDAFVRTDIDETILVGGKSLVISRQYDSLQQNVSGQLGDGWRFTFGQTRLQLGVTPQERAGGADPVALEAIGVYSGLSRGDRLYLDLPDGTRGGFTFDPTSVQPFAQNQSLVFYRPHWVADPGIDFTIDSLDQLLVAGGNRFYDHETGQPYHPANQILGTEAYRLTYPDGTVDVLSGDGRVSSRIWSDGEVWRFSDSGIVLPGSQFIPIISDDAGRVVSIRLPASLSSLGDLHYKYDEQGRLIEVAATGIPTAGGSIHRYGYESADVNALTVAVSADGDNRSYPDANELTADLGRAIDFAGREVIGEIQAGQTDQYAFTIDQDQLRSTSERVVWVRAMVQRYRSTFVADTPRIAGLDPIARSVDGDRTVALFAIDRADQYLLQINGASAEDDGRYQLYLDVVGDINRDGSVDGLDSGLIFDSFGTFVGDLDYDARADFNSDGVINVADSQLLAANFGFTSDFTALALSDRFVTNPLFPIYQGDPIFGPPPTTETPVDPSTGSDTRITPPPAPPQPVDPPVLVPVPLAPIGGASFGIRNGLFDAAGDQWSVLGDVSFDGGAATLRETTGQRTSVRQAFFVPDNASILRFAVNGLSLTATDGRTPDALEVALLDANTFAPLAGQLGIGDSDALLNFAADGSYLASANVTVGNADSSDPSIDLGGIVSGGRLLVQIDLTGVPTGTLAVLSFDLLSFAESLSEVTIDNVFLVTGPLRSPVANTDLVSTDEDTPVVVNVLANDVDNESLLDPRTLQIHTGPSHGQLYITSDTGHVTYLPDRDYSGNDSFTYTVKDADGYVSNEAFVSITVAPITDDPHLSTQKTAGPQDTPLPLVIDASAMDIDGSEDVMLTIQSLPQGATLSSGTRVADGYYRLRVDELTGLNLIPAAGWSGQANLDVGVTAVDQSADPVFKNATLAVTVDSVIVEPLSVTAFEVNRGEDQRSEIYTLAVTFNQDAWIVDPSSDIFVIDIDGVETRITPSRYHYDSETFELSIDVDGLITGDNQYFLAVRTSGIASAANRLQTLATGPEIGGEYLPLPFHRLLGDINGNNEVDVEDWQDIRLSLNSNADSDRYQRHRDLTGEGIIDRHDFVVWRNRLGLTTDNVAPQIIAAVTLPGNALPLIQSFQSNAELSLVINDVSDISSVTMSINGSPTMEIVGELSADRSLRLPLADLFARVGQSYGEGDHTLSLVAVDKFGNTSDPFEVEFTIDDTAPPTPSSPVLLQDDGSEVVGVTVADPNVTIRSVGETGSIVRLFRDGEEVGLGVAQSPVDFPINLTGLGDGVFTFTATAEDPSGNRSATSSTLEISIDTTAPIISALGLDPASDTGTIGDQTTDNDVVTLIGTTEPGSTVTLLEPMISTTADGAGNFSLTGVPLRFGPNALTISAADSLGNARQRSINLFRPRLESNAPTIALALAEDTGLYFNDAVTSRSSVSGAISDESAIAGLFLSADVVGSQTSTARSFGPVDVTGFLTGTTFALSPSDIMAAIGQPLDDGAVTISVYAVDVYDNTSAPQSVGFTLDTSAPAAPTNLMLAPESDFGRSDNDAITYATKLSLTMGIAEQATVDVFVDGVSHAHFMMPGGSSEVTLTGLDEGTRLITATITDLAGNVSTLSDSLSVLIDTTSPDTLTSEIVLPGLGSDSGSVTGVTEGDATVFLYRGLDSQTIIAETISAADGSFRFDGVKLRNGLNRFRVVAEDLAGNPIEIEVSTTYEAPDLSPPEIGVALANDTGAFSDDLLTKDATVTGIVDDASRIASFQVSVAGGPFVNTLGSLRDNAFTLDRSVLESIAGRRLVDGQNTVRLRATDIVGHVSDVVEFSFVLDTTRPDTPTPLVLDAATDSGTPGDGITNSPTLTFTTSTVANDAEVVLFVDGQPVDRAAAGGDVTLSVSTLAGRHRYVAQTIDNAGNVSFFTAPRFVTFDDTFVTPTVGLIAQHQRLDLGSSLHTTTSPVTLVGAAESGTRLEVLGRPNFADAGDLDRFQIEGVQLVPGVNQLQILATDPAGNSATVSLEVIFIDADGPQFDLDLVNDTGRSDSDNRTQDPTIGGTIRDASDVASLFGSLDGRAAVDITSALNEDLLSIDLARLETLFGGTLPDGRHLLSLVATDIAGNASMAELQFDLDRTGPPIQTPPDLLTASDLGHDSFDNLTADPEPTIRMFAERGALVKFYLDDNFVGEVLSTGVAQYTFPALDSGIYNVTATIEDAAGNLAGPSDPLVISIDTEPPADITLEMFAIHQSSVRANHTTDDQVNLAGTAEPGSRITMTGQNEMPIVDALGRFFFVVDLNVGDNEFLVTSEDPAGNVTERTFVFTRGELLPPTFTFNVVDQGSLTPPLIQGQLRSENPIVGAIVSTDPTFNRGVFDLTAFMSGEQFTLDATDMEVINGAPFVDGDHSLYFVAADSVGRQSDPTEVTWTRDSQSQPNLVTSVTPIGNDYRYVITATGATDISQRLDSIIVPMPIDVVATDFVVPSGWSVTYAPSDDSIVLTAIDPLIDGLSGNNQITFSYTAATAPTPGEATMTLADLSQGQTTRAVSVMLQTPTAGSVFAVTDYYSLTASEILSVDASIGVRSNDSVGVSTVEQFDAVSRWGASVDVAADGSFTFSPGGVFDGLASGETVIDSFTYSLRDSGNQLATATVYMTVSGLNQSPTAVDDTPSEATPTLFTRAGTPIAINPSDLTLNDWDVNINDRLTVTSIDGVSQQGATISFVDGNFVYDPTGVAAFDSLPAGDHLLDQFTYTISDPEGLTDSAVAQIWVQSPVNLVPVASPTALTVSEDGDVDPATFQSLLTGAGDSDRLPGDPPLAMVQETVTSVKGASVTIAADGTFVYDASGAAAIDGLSSGETTDDSFMARVTDGFDPSAPVMITLLVTGINDAPNAVDDLYTGVSANGLLSTTIINGVLANDTDVDSPSPLVVDPSQTETFSVGGARVTLRPDGTFDYDPAGAFAELAEGETAIDTFTYVVLDDRGAESIATVSIEVIGVDDAPIAGTDGIEKGFWTVASQKIEIPASSGVLVNDYDPDAASNGTILEASFDGFSQYGARVIVHADGSFSYDPTVSAAIAQLQADGIDVVDTFTYTIREVIAPPPPGAIGSDDDPVDADPPQASSEGVVEVILRARPSNYSFDLVADQIGDIGGGVSINNKGNVAFQTTNNGSDYLYIWSDDTGPLSLVPEGFVSGGQSVSQPPNNGTGGIPSALFSHVVQINDDDRVFAQRQLNANALLGMPIMGVPILTFTDVALTYAELWNGGRVLGGDRYGTPRQIGVGDLGIANAGLRWGNPQMLDLQLVTLLGGLLPGAIGFAISAQFQLVPRIWTLNPVWASAYYTPVNPVWNVFQDPDNFDFDVLNAVSLATSLVPIWVPQLYVTPFIAIYPSTASVNNAGQSIFVASTNNSETEPGLKLVTYGHEGRKPYTSIPIDQPVSFAMMADTGHSVFTTDGAVTIVDFDLNETSSGDFISAGDQAAISDSGYVAVAGEGPMGEGVYVINAEDGKWAKVVGISGDGTLDANEVDVNGDDVGSIEAILPGPIGINGPKVGDQPGTPYFTITFMAMSEGKESLQAVSFFPGELKNDSLFRPLFIGLNRVVTLGESLPGIGTISEIRGFDIINNSGQIVFTDGQKVVRANPPLNATGDLIYAFERRNISENEVFRRDGGAAVARFIAGDPMATAGQFSAVIDFGDGTTGTGMIVPIDDLPLGFEVVAEHQYDREGPYAITVQITDNNNRTGGVAVSLANIVNTVNEEDIEKLVLVDDEGNAIEPTIQSYASPLAPQNDQGGGDRCQVAPPSDEEIKSAGLSTRATLDRSTGNFDVVSVGYGGFIYSYGLATAGSNGQGEPNASQSGGGSAINIRKVLASGKLDPIAFSTDAFQVERYETGFDGASRGASCFSTTSISEVSDTEVHSESYFVDEKTYEDGTFDWVLTTDKSSTYLTSGERFVDGDLQSQIDSLIGGSGSAFVGDFVVRGTETSHEVLRE